MMLEILRFVTLAAVAGSASAAAVFVFRFMRTTWYQTELGRIMMSLMATMMVLISLTFVVPLVGRTWIGWPYVGLISWVWIFLIFVRLDLILVRKQREGGRTAPMNFKFKFNPVAWLTTASGVLLAVQAANETFDILPDKVAAIIGFISLVLVLWLGRQAHVASTPLANPQTNDGTPLVPAPEATARRSSGF